MSDRFVPLTPRIGAKAVMRRDEVLDPAFADECLDALERYGVLLFPQIGLSDEEQVAFSKNLGEVVPQGPMRPDGTQDVVFKITLDPRENPSAEYLKATIGWHIDGLFEDGPPPKATMLSGPAPLGDGWADRVLQHLRGLRRSARRRSEQYYESLRIVHSLEASNRATQPEPDPGGAGALARGGSATRSCGANRREGASARLAPPVGTQVARPRHDRGPCRRACPKPRVAR